MNISVSSGYTDANGYYTVGRLASGSYKVLFTNTAYGTNYADQWYSGKYDFTSADPVSVTLAQTTAGIDAVLQEGGKITGRVTNALGAGINNVWIGVVDANDDTRSLGGTWTDSNGNYTPDCDLLSGASQDLRASGGDFCGAWTGASANFGRATSGGKSRR